MRQNKLMQIATSVLLLMVILTAGYFLAQNRDTANTDEDKTEQKDIEENKEKEKENEKEDEKVEIPQPNENQFRNPIAWNGADPWVVKHTDGLYYYTHTTGNNITIWKSETLVDIGLAKRKIVWSPSPGAPNSGSIWAPEHHFIDGKWYIYYAASVENDDKRMYVLESEGEDPWGPYDYPEGTEETYGQITDPSNKWAIDGTVLEHEGKLYFVWSGWEGDVNVSQNTYIAPMSNPWTISGERVEISRPELSWEANTTPKVQEGPQVLRNEQGQLFLIYSASGSWTNTYSLGMLTFVGDDPLDPAAWEKSQQPVFAYSPENEVWGPGHNSFVKSADGTEDWIVYHAAKEINSGWDRNVRMQKFTWNEDGTPNFGVPVHIDTILDKPSGE
nr:glycoside hydrolase family 43 protein [Paenibacillus bovis]